MKTSLLIRLGSSALLLGVTAVGCTTPHPASLSSNAPKSKPVVKLARSAEAAIKAHQPDQAVLLGEQAVAASPNDARARATLGQAYMIAGRFASAATSFAESLSLQPEQPRARFSLALSQIALGEHDAAIATLAKLDTSVPETDVGLATVLAGDMDRGIVLLEHAAREKGATPKARQNLALAYTMAGRWNEARAVAEQDVPADQLALRLAQWAQFSRPQMHSSQVASLLGVMPAVDLGRPMELALAGSVPAAAGEAPVALAAAEPAPQPVAEPVRTAAVEAPPQSFVAPVAASARPASLVLASATPRHVAVRQIAPPRIRTAASGKWVVQLGAFSQASAINAAWSRIAGHVAGLSPSQSTFARDGAATLYRLTVAGFGTRGDAVRMCEQVKAKGGRCFVRAAAGDLPIQMASAASVKIAMR